MNANAVDILPAYLTGESLMAQVTSERGESHSRIARLAYQFYEERGRQDGHDLDDWLRAEGRLRNG